MDFYQTLCIIVEIWFGSSDLRMLMGKFRHFLTELSAHDTSVFSFLDDNLSKYQWIFTKLVCTLILWRSGLGLLMAKFHQMLTELSTRDMSLFSFPDGNLSKYQWNFATL